ncbi:MAG: UbiA family prenyltransferase [Bacteroidota bacterium]|nr:UbiA family prenyltransferase [Bacteroidota bacterium]MDX5448368.1 UbiA family prenyltransferase [Bacteroidota bacterium]MDX5505479.1 UbiA family prenyltransferase [Bacteroidota bacterium]
MIAISRKFKVRFLKGVAFLSIIRWPNLMVLLLAQYLAAIFVMNDPSEWFLTLREPKLHLITLATFFIVAAGYILNNFYDWEKDMINRPHLTVFQRMVSRSTSLRVAFLFNTIGMLMALSISWKGALFFFTYGTLIWLYSHKFKKITLLGNLLAAALSIFPFFGIFFHYGIPSISIWVYTALILNLLFLRELVKDGTSVKGDIIVGYETLVARYGWDRIRWFLVLSALPLLPIGYFLYIREGRYIQWITLMILFSTFGSFLLLFLSHWNWRFSVVNFLFRLILLLGIGGLIFL